MKRIISVLAVICLLVGCSVAFAATIKITKQPETQTTKAGGSLTFKVKASNASGAPVTWYFTSPDGDTYTGRKLGDAKELKGLRVSNPNNLNITLKKIPEAMHGWSLYCHIGGKSGGVDSDTVMILIAGKALPEAGSDEADDVPETAKATKAPKQKSGSKATKAPAEEAAATPAPTPAPVETKGPVVIKASKLELYALDKSGKISGTSQKELTFENGDANFYVKLPSGTEGYIQYITVGSVRLTPEGEVRGMSVRGWPSSATVKAKVAVPGTERTVTEEPPVDESTLVAVTCTNCRFSGWHTSFAESGKVPVGSTITVVASGGVIHKGYTINGKESQYKDQASFQMVVEGETTISMDKQK